MAETRTLPIIEEEEIGEEFYEKIEAPKFVDFTAPDLRLPDDDRRWFCLRVGCDQRHEEELDSEAIYKNFVLRVMAARSPNVRLRKALNRREASENLKCPLTAPAKPRVSRLALIHSLSQKMVDNNVKAKPLSKVTATPNAKLKRPSAVAKALTTPRNQKKASNIEQFRTVQSKKAMTVVVPKNNNRGVAKVLVFHSPKKVVKTKNSVQSKNTPVKALCSAMKKLELDDTKKNGEGCDKSLPAVAASRKQSRGREVKSRVFDSLYSNNNRKGPETKNMKCLREKKKKKAKDLQKRQVTVPREEDDENDSSDMEIDEKSRGGSLEGCSESGTSGGGDELSLGAVKSQEPTRGESSCLALAEASRNEVTSLSSSKEEEENKNTEGSEIEEKRNPVSGKGKIPEATKRKDKENSLASDDDKENEGELTENYKKENASAPDENRVLINHNDDPKKVIIGSKHEDLRKTHKKSTSSAAGSQAVKYRKLKPTNPKPFKLRTDERGILKEANLEKIIPLPSKEITAKGGKAMRKCQNVNRKSETCPAQSEQDTDNYYSSEERSDQTTQEDHSGSIQSAGIDNSNGKVQNKLSATTPHRNPGPKLQKKPIDLDNQLEHQDKAAKKLDDNFKRKPQMVQCKVVRPRGVLSTKKEKVLARPGKLSVIIEKPSKTLKSKAAANPGKADGSSSMTCSRGRRAGTVPKEPKFHSLHVPKSCIKKLT